MCNVGTYSEAYEEIEKIYEESSWDNIIKNYIIPTYKEKLEENLKQYFGERYTRKVINDDETYYIIKDDNREEIIEISGIYVNYTRNIENYDNHDWCIELMWKPIDNILCEKMGLANNTYRHEVLWLKDLVKYDLPELIKDGIIKQYNNCKDRYQSINNVDILRKRLEDYIVDDILSKPKVIENTINHQNRIKDTIKEYLSNTISKTGLDIDIMHYNFILRDIEVQYHDESYKGWKRNKWIVKLYWDIKRSIYLYNKLETIDPIYSLDEIGYTLNDFLNKDFKQIFTKIILDLKK